MNGDRMPLAGVLAVTSGAVGLAAGFLSFPVGGQMGSPMDPMAASPLPPTLLVVFSAVVLINGLLLIVGRGFAPRPQGGLMLLYGGLMILVGCGRERRGGRGRMDRPGRTGRTDRTVGASFERLTRPTPWVPFLAPERPFGGSVAASLAQLVEQLTLNQ